VERTQKHRTTSFATAPIAALSAAAIAMVLISLAIGARETDGFALARQRETIAHALEQHGRALGRELRAQTVWTEGYERTRAGDEAWMRAYMGRYLSDLFGYDGIYVLSGEDKTVFSYEPDGSAHSADLPTNIMDLIRAVRDPTSMPTSYDVIDTDVRLDDGAVVQHRAVSDIRNVDGRPATVVVSTIVPDRSGIPQTSKPYLLVAVEDLDRGFTKRLGAEFEFRDLEWVTGEAPAADVVDTVKALDGSTVGTLAWRSQQPGWDFVKRVALGLGLALALLVVLATLLMRWSRQQARQLVQSEAAERLAGRTDILTGLPNRLALNEAFATLLDQSAERGFQLGVLSIDIDDFKRINDDFGNAIGDAVLRAIGARLRRLLRPSIVLARHDSDGFTVLAPRIDADQLAELASDVIARVAEPVELDGGTRVFVTASAGYALAPRDGDDGDDLMRRAELALAKAKADGGDEAAAFVPEMDLELSRRRALEAALRKAVSEGTIDVVYQPLMDPSGTRVVSAEALARWTDPLLGSVPPDVFIPLAEESGLIPKIGEFVLRRAVSDAAAWPRIRVAVNVSAAQMHHGDVVAVVSDVLEGSNFTPHRLEIEITESVLLADEKRANEQIRRLQALGVRVALDDFGTGYSSLHYLRSFGFDKLKIDQSFIRDLGSEEGAVILASIISLGLNLDMTLTAEGVETEEQRRWLQESGCHQLQGYLFSRPLSAAGMGAFLAAHDEAAAATG
jgi:diguanylate cyclase (GGDEF)-like protein